VAVRPVVAVAAVVAVAGDAMTTADLPPMPRPPERRELLFVYGTLRPALIHRAQAEAPRELIKRVRLVGPATVPGLLFDLGAYPGFVHHEPRAAATDQATPAAVVGDLVEVTADQLAVLDAYEECGGPSPLYRREQIQARQQNGSERDCWIYVYARSTSAAALIPSGDYALHLAR